MTKRKRTDASKPVAPKNTKLESTRREFLNDGSKLAVAGAAMGTIAAPSLSIARSAHAFGSDTVRIGLIGCGGRGTGASVQAMNTTTGNVELVAMGDAFPKSSGRFIEDLPEGTRKQSSRSQRTTVCWF